MTGMPRRAASARSRSGKGAPPMRMARRFGRKRRSGLRSRTSASMAGTSEASVTPSRARVSGKRAPEKPGEIAIVAPAASVLMMIPRPPTRAGESESWKTSDEVMRRARTMALAPAVRDSRVRMAGFGRPVVPDVKTTKAAPSGRGSAMESAWDLRASCSAEVSLGETRTAGMCASQWARMSTRPFRSGFGMRKAGRPGAGSKARPYDPRRDGRVPPT